MLDYLSRNQQTVAPNLTALYYITFSSSEWFTSQLLKPFVEEKLPPHKYSLTWIFYSLKIRVVMGAILMLHFRDVAL